MVTNTRLLGPMIVLCKSLALGARLLLQMLFSCSRWNFSYNSKRKYRENKDSI